MTPSRFAEVPEGSPLLEELANDGAIALGIAVERAPAPEGPVRLRAAGPHEMPGWMSELTAVLPLISGSVVAFVGEDTVGAGWLAAEAAAWAGENGASVTLIDGCVERPVIAKAAASDLDEGLVDAALFGVTPERVARRTLTTGVRLVTAGSRPPSLPRLLESGALTGTTRALADGRTVFIVLPRAHLATLADGIDALVVLAATPEELRSSIGDAGAMSGPRVGFLAVERERVEAAPEATADAVAASGAGAEASEPEAAPQATPDAVAASGAGAEKPGPEAEPEPAPEASEEPRPKSPAGPESGPEHRQEPEPKPRPRPEAQEVQARSRDDAARRAPEPVKPVELPVMRADRRPPAGKKVREKGPARGPGVKERDRQRGRRRSGVVWSAVAVVAVAVVALLYMRYGLLPERPDAVPGDAGAPTVSEETSPGATLDAPEEGAETAGPHSTEEEPGGEIPAGASTATTAGAREPTDGGIPPADGAASPGFPLAGPGGRYVVLISSHKYATAAEAESHDMEELGVTTQIIEVELETLGIWYRVAVSGGYPTLAAAREALDTVKGFGYEGAWIEHSSGSD